MIRKVLDSAHVFTDDAILPLQNVEPTRKTTVKARLWVYARSRRRHKPLVVHEFSRSRSQEAPLGFLADYCGYVQADVFPGYDRLYGNLHIHEIACWVHARRKYVEVMQLMREPGRAHEALRFIKELYRIERQIRTLSDAESEAPAPGKLDPRPQRVQSVARYSSACRAAQKCARHRGALHTEKLGRPVPIHQRRISAPDNNYAEQCLRPVALGRKSFLFVGSERAGHAAVIYYSLVESCKVNQVNPLTYLTYVLANVRHKSVTILTPDEFTVSNMAHVG